MMTSKGKQILLKLLYIVRNYSVRIHEAGCMGQLLKTDGSELYVVTETSRVDRNWHQILRAKAWDSDHKPCIGLVTFTMRASASNEIQCDILSLIGEQEMSWLANGGICLNNSSL